MKHLDDVALVSSICDMTATPQANTGLGDNFKMSCSLADSLKKSFKRDVIIFTICKEEKN